MDNRNSDRLKSIVVSPGRFLQFLIGEVRLTEEALKRIPWPRSDKFTQGVKLVGASFDAPTNSFILVLYHPSFEPILEGDAIPRIDLELCWTPHSYVCVEGRNLEEIVLNAINSLRLDTLPR